MDAPDLERLERLFQRAADLSRADRSDYLDQACAGDAPLRAQVEALLARFERDQSLESPAPPAPAVPAGAGEAVGSVVGRYKLLQEIGEGGFGVVYMAEQRDPVTRKVAVKLLKAGMDSKEVLARFEAERQALALMDHPNIAHVLDGGETPSGRPYFVMELVRGVPITEYCDTNTLGTRERLALFETVCVAIQHAHQKGVIHRDVKPSNVLVTMLDGRPVVKVIDFGVAKAIHQPLTERTLFTAYGRFIGTPAYMSPEQAEMSAVDVDTRSDIYSLGVLLYELLTGSTPFDVQSAFDVGLAELQRVIREDEPVRPSVRLSTTADAAVARQRGAEPRALGKLVRGELDWIVLKALAKERDRRYSTASELAADVERFLAGEAVDAGPPTAAYRLRKALGRHRGALLAVGLVLLSLLLGVIGLSHGLILAERQRDAALASRADGDAMNRFLIETIALTDPAITNDPDASVRELLDRAAARAGETLDGRPWAEAGVRATIGRAYLTLGETRLAEANLRRALELWDEVDDVDPLERYRATWHLTGVCFDLERPDSWEFASRARTLGHDLVEAQSPGLARELRAFSAGVEASAYRQDQVQMDAARAAFEASLLRARADLPPGDPLWPVLSDTYLAGCLTLWYSPFEVEAARFYAESYRIRREELGPFHFDTATILAFYIGFLNRIGRPEEAEGLAREAVTAMRRATEDGNPNLAFLESLLGETLTMLGRFEEAEVQLLESHEQMLAKFEDEGSFLPVDSLGRIVALYAAWERPEELRTWRARLASICASSRQVQPWQIVQRALPAEAADLLAALNGLNAAVGGWNYGVAPGAAAPEGIEAIVEDVTAACRAHLDQDGPLARALGRGLTAWAHALDPERATSAREALLDEALALLAPATEVLPYDAADALALKARMRVRAGDPSAANAFATEAADLLRSHPSSGDNFLWAGVRARVGAACLRTGRLSDARLFLAQAQEVFELQFGSGHPDTGATADLLVEAG